MLFSIIICSYNRGNYINFVLQSLSKQTVDTSIFEIVIVNNNSTDNTEEICQKFIEEHKNLNILYFIEKNQGLSFARNRGINEASGDIIIFLDDDAIACKNYLEEVKIGLENNAEFTAFGGKILPKFEKKKPQWMSKYIVSLVSVIDLGHKIKPFPRNKYPIGANMGFKKEIFKKYGFFDTNLGRTGKNMMGGEEKDLFDRLTNGNEKILYLPDAWVYHIIPESRLTKEFIRKQAYGIGESERIRIKGKAKDIAKKVFSEIFKWGATIFLFVVYFLSIQTSKALMLIRIRYWINRGLTS